MSDNGGDTLVQRRSRRSTAGNRMESALAEMALEGPEPEIEDDNEFENKFDEEDVFESDFQSTDEEAEKEVFTATEQSIAQEEKQERAAARSRRTAKLKAARVTIAFDTASPSQILKRKRDETSSIKRSGGNAQSRQSRRKTTILNTKELNARMRDAEERRTIAVKPKKSTSDDYKSQHELIQEALDMEESNTQSHRNYLASEEERRAKATTIQRTMVTGPRLRWISKTEKVRLPSMADLRYPPPAGQIAGWHPPHPYGYYAQYAQFGQYSPMYQNSTARRPPTGQPTSLPAAANTSTASANSYAVNQPGGSSATGSANATIPAAPPASSSSEVPAATSSSSTLTPFTPYAPAPAVAMAGGANNPQYYSPAGYHYFPYNPYYHQASLHYAALQGNSNSTEPHEIKQTRNYLIHEVIEGDQTAAEAADTLEKTAKRLKESKKRDRKGKSSQPAISWEEHMSAVFGDHVNWGELKVLSGKFRPLERVKEKCPITGQVAPYRDPRTNTPFASIAAYQTITAVLEHSFVWDSAIGCYIAIAPS